MFKNKKIIIFIVGALIFTVLLIVTLVNRASKEETLPDTIVGGDKDVHGCIGSAGYSWCEAKQKCLRVFEEFCPNEAQKLVDAIKTASGVELISTGSTTFNWIVGDQDRTADSQVEGVIYQIDNIKWTDYEKIEKYLDSQQQQDIYNLADGVVGGQRGYLINYMACILNFRHNQMKEVANQPTEPEGDSLNVKLECGYFNPNDKEKILTGQIIKEILAQKYKKAINEVWVTIHKSDDNHTAGSILFGQGGPGEGGMFLAAKVDNQWQVLFDGNGSVDCNKMRGDYQFSDEILEGFCDPIK